ncbi:uncharacterized protein LOC120421280 [Culex pipiens pallens]|uniref:uncharacterized protein LOC120421280 n=1 Tax=Culex pipiens pallens TaxID=42434 RepID=UPI0022AA90BF|nr:uncharacterized protein LOC120421280 [Culex pipiens pallens]
MDQDIMQAILQSMEPGASTNPLLLEECNQVSLLHKAIKLQHEKKSEIVQFLIESSLVECDQRDADGKTATEVVLTQLGDRELAKAMVSAELVNLSDERSFYVMIRRGSVPVYKLFLECKSFDGEQIFRRVSNAMIELNARRVPITMEMEVFVQYQLTRFAHNNLYGDVGGVKDPNEWRTHFAVIEDHWQALKKKFGDRNYANVDNEFLFRIKAIHNHLFFVKDKRFLKHLPVMEATFCLAILVSIFECGTEYELFKFLINKINMMQYLETICRQLKLVKAYLDKLNEHMNTLVSAVPKDEVPSKEQLYETWTSMNTSMNLQENIINRLISGLKKKVDPNIFVSEIIASEISQVSVNVSSRDGSVLHNLKRNYFRAKQLYSIQKCLFHIEGIAECRKCNDSKYLTVPAVKRLIQVIGESIKSTKNSPNVPKVVGKILNTMLTALFPDTNKYFREFFSHKYPLAKRFLSNSTEANLFHAIATHSEYTGMIFAIIFICTLLNVSRTLLGTMRRCRDTAELQSLLQYVSILTLPEVGQMQFFDKIMRKFKEMEQTINATEIHTVEDQDSVKFLLKDLQRKTGVIDVLRKSLLRNWHFNFLDIKDACLAKASISKIHRIIDWNLSLSEQKEVYQIIYNQWMDNHVTLSSLHPRNTKLLNMDGTVLSGVLANIERKLVAIKDEECIENTRGILVKLGVSNPTKEMVEHFHKQLLKYYEDIFFIDNKFMAIRKFFKSNKLPLNEEALKVMRSRDEQDLQDIFNKRVEAIRTILNGAGILSIEDLSTKVRSIPNHVLMALELYQLELCEMLITVGYYGDNFQLLKHRIPLIYGRNYRNFLAHDSLSYNVLTDSSRVKIAVNALVFIESNMRLFKQNVKPKSNEFTFPSETVVLSWTLEQVSLVESIQSDGWNSIKSTDLFGRHCGTVGTVQPLSSDMTSIEFANPNLESFQKLLAFFAAKISENTSKITTLGYRVWYALQLGNYEEAFNLFKQSQPVRNSKLPQEFFSWDLIVDYLLTEMSDWDERDALGRTVLHRLIQAGNRERVSLLLEIMPDIDVNAADRKERTPLDYAIDYGCSECVQLLLSRNAAVSSTNQQSGIVFHMNDSLVRLFAGFSEELLTSQAYVNTAVRSNNLTALKFLIDKFYNDSHKNLRAEHLNSSLGLAAYLNHYSIVEYLSSIPDVNYFSDEFKMNGNFALHHAINRNHKKVVKLLLDMGASPNWINVHSTQNLNTAFQLAVNINNQKMIKMMQDIDQYLYLSNTNLKHPVQCAMQHNSPKLVRCLGKFGFSLLNTGRILQNAIQRDNTTMIDAILRELDLASVSNKSLADPVLRDVGELLTRWKTMAYLEEPNGNPGRETSIAIAVLKGNLTLLTTLVDRCVAVRSFGDSYLHSITVYKNRKQINSYFCEDMLEKRFLLSECDKLLSTLKKCSNQKCVGSTIQITFRNESDEFNVNGTFRVFMDSDLFSEIMPVTIRESFENDLDKANLSETCFKLILDHLKNLNCNIYGSFQKHFFIICGESAYLLQTVDSQQTFPLKALVNFGSSDGETPLHNCYGADRLDIVRLLIFHGGNPLAINTVGQTPLHLTLTDKDVEKAMYLLKLCVDQDLRSPDGTPAAELPNGLGFRPLHLAAMTCKLEVVRFLIDHCNVDLRAKDAIERVPVIYALAGPHMAILKLLLERDPAAINIPDNRGQTTVHYSAVRCNVDVIAMMLPYGVDLFLSDKNGANPVQVAMESKSLEWLKVVFDYARSQKIVGLLKHLGEAGIPALHFTLLFSEPELSTLVVEYEIDASLNETLSLESLEKMKLLLTARTADEGYTPLHVGTTLGLEKSIKFVLKCQNLYNQHSGEKLNLVTDLFDLSGRTPLDYALEMGNESLINVLLEN